MKIPFVVLGLLCGACAATPQRVVRNVPDTQLTPVPAGVVYADGAGPTEMDAVRDARAALSKQVSKHTGRTFEWPDLFRVLEVRTDGRGTWVARVELDPGRTAAHSEREHRAVRQLLADVEPELKRALERPDPRILLLESAAPDALLARWDEANALAQLVGEKVTDAPSALTRTAAKAAEARARVVITLSVTGRAPQLLKDAARREFTRLLGDRGCAVGRVGPGDVSVEGRIAVAVRDHVEAGLDWRYLGLSLTLHSHGEVIFAFDGMPEFAHGGGRDARAAEAATARNLVKALDDHGAAEFAALVCDDS